MYDYYQMNCYSRNGRIIFKSPMITSICDSGAIDYFVDMLSEMDVEDYKDAIMSKIQNNQIEKFETGGYPNRVRMRINLDID